MKYSGIDFHSNDSVVSMLDKQYLRRGREAVTQ